jgi:hydrogenase nickel incorporation protein HypA/HybF
MHEASIALSIVDIAGRHCRQEGYNIVQSIVINVGSASGVVTGTLLSAFDIVKTDTIAKNAELVINEIQLGGMCSDCGSDFTAEEQFIIECPVCKGSNFSLDRGRELDVLEIEVA